MGEFVMMTKLDWMKKQLYNIGEPCPEWYSYLREHHIDHKVMLAHCGIMAVTFCKAYETADDQYVFEFAECGDICVVIEGLVLSKVDGVYDYITVDLVAWPIGAPDHFATAMGPGAGIAILGPVAAFHEPSDKTPLKLYRTPESWLVNGCEGSVVLKPEEATRWLGRSDVPLICEDREHASEVSQLLGEKAAKRDIFIPKIGRAA